VAVPIPEKRPIASGPDLPGSFMGLVQGDLYPIALLASFDGLGMPATLDTALKYLRTARVRVEGSALVFSRKKEMATILLLSGEDSRMALNVLARAGFQVKAGPAGF
jgi:hypothetical protein